MHALPRLRLPHLISASAVAAIIAIVISLAFAATLSPLSRPGEASGTPARSIAPALAIPRRAPAPRWARDAFANLLSGPLPQPWRAARG